MSVIILPNRFQSQPQYAAPINWHHPYLQDAAYIFRMVGNVGVIESSLGNRGFTPTEQPGWAKKIVKGGWSYQGSGSTNLSDNSGFVSSADPHTIFGVFQQADEFNRYSSLGQHPQLVTGGIPSYTTTIGGADRVFFADRNPSLGEQFAFAGVNTGSAQYTLLNGVKQASTGAYSGGGYAPPPAFTIYSTATPVLFGAVWRRAVPDSVLAELGRNPWQVFKAPKRRLWAASSAPASHDLTAANASQDNVASTAGVTQTHALVGSASAQSNAASAAAVTQTHTLIGQTSVQSNAASVGSIAQAHALTAAGSDQANSATAGSISQIHTLVGAASVQTNATSSTAISQGATHNLSVAASTQANETISGTVTQVHSLVGTASEQTNTSTAASVTQIHALTTVGSVQANAASAGAVTAGTVHNLAAAASTQINTGTPRAVTQTHLLIHAPSIQDNIAATSAIVQQHMLEALNGNQTNATPAGTVTQAHILICPETIQTNTGAASVITQTHTLGGSNSIQVNSASERAVNPPASPFSAQRMFALF